MKNLLKTGIFIFALLILYSCRNTKDKISNLESTKSIYKDSIVEISSRILQNSKIDTTKAREIVNSHFKNKGFLIQSELDFETFDLDLPENVNKKAIDFIKISLFHLIKKRGELAIISYFKCDPFENGHCVEPHYAIFANTNQGLEILNEDFLPHNFVIEKVEKFYVFGYYYECANQIKLKHYKICLE